MGDREKVLHEQHAMPAAVAASAPQGSDPIFAPFKVQWAHQSKWSEPRGKVPTSVVIHCTGATNPAKSTADYFAGDNSSGSTQAVADDVEGWTMVPDDAVCAGAPPLNQEGLHIEQPGLVTWTTSAWLAREFQLRRVAYHVAGWCRTYDIPVRLLDAAALRSQGEGARGITWHGAVSDAFGQSTHTDPGPNFPWPTFLSYVEAYLEEGDMAFTPEQEDQLKGLLRFNNQAGLPPDASDAMKTGFNNAKQRWQTAMENPPAGGGKPTKPFDATITPKP